MPQRLMALDALRGLTVALMILVNNPGSWAHVWPPLRHAAWHGCTPADLVFPFFLFSVGASLSLSFARRRDAGATTADLLRKVVTRAAVICGLGLLLNAFPYGLPLNRAQAAEFHLADIPGSLATLRYCGVLQRIGLAYLLAGTVVVLWRGARARLLAAVGMVLLYEAAMRLPWLAGWGGGSFAPADNFARWFDLQFIGEPHMYRVGDLASDPEGLIPTLNAAVSILGGFGAGEYLRRRAVTAASLRRLSLVAAGGSLVGLALAAVEPVNKSLWTLSYVLLTGGLAGAVLAGCVWLLDIKRRQGWARPAVIFGSNPLVAFFGSGILARLLLLTRWPDGAGGVISPKRLITNHWLTPWAGPELGSVLFALLNVAVWLGILWWLHRRRVYVKV